MDPQNPKPRDAKGRFLLASSPLVAGGKARLMSAKKVKPKPAEPREVSELEAHGYTDQPHKGLNREAQALDEWEYRLHVKGRADDDEEKRQQAIVNARDREKRLLSQEQRLRKAEAEAALNRRDVSHEVFVLRRMLERGRAVQAERRLQKIELYAYRGKRAA